MSLRLLFVTVITLLTIQHAQSAACPQSSDTGVATGNGTCDVTDATTGTTIQLNFNTGFDSTTLIENDNAAALATDTYLNTDFAATVVSNAATASIASGNKGATVGAQRKLSFIKAAEIIASQIVSAETIIIEADFSALSCSAGGGTLGSAGAAANLGNVTLNKNGVSNPPAGQIANTFYPIALLNAMGSDDYGAGSDINANYNSNIGNSNCLVSSNGWYYGFDAPVGVHYDEDVNGNPISWSGGADIIIEYTAFTTVLLHEILHGLGFASLTDAGSGAKASGIDDIFSNFLYSLSDNKSWTVADALSNGQRAASAISGTGLLWAGTNVNTQAVGLLTDGFNNSGTGSSVLFEADDKVEMYAPNPVESGSSVSHFNTDASPNELMEPQYTEYLESLGLALYLLKDIGWTVLPPGANTAPTITISGTPYSTNEDTAKVIDASGWDSDADGDSLTFSVSSCPANITCSIDADGQNLTLTPATNYYGATNSVEITVTDDGTGNLTASDSFNLNVIAQNDPPTWSAISTQNVTIGGSAVDVDLSGYTSDVENDSLTYSQISCGSGLSCSLSGSTMTLTGVSNAGATVSVEVQADDGNSGQTNKTFSVAIAASANNAPTWSTIPAQDHTVGDTASINLNSYASDSDGDSMTYTGCESTSICSISSNTLTINTGSVASDSITITANDGNGGSTDSASFSISITAANNAPTWSTIPAQDHTVGDTASINLNSYASDSDGDSMTYTGCESNSICSISSNTLTINTGSVASDNITVTANDGNGGSTDSASFSISITAANNAPTWSTIYNQSVEVGSLSTISLNAYASDLDGDTLTFSGCDSTAICSISSEILTINTASASSATITIQVDDGNGGTTGSNSFDILVYDIPVVDFNGSTLNPNDSSSVSNTQSIQLDASAVSEHFTYSLELDGNNHDSLLNLDGTDLTIAIPSSGQFAGNYDLTITDPISGSTYTYTFTRAPRFDISATKLLANTSVQTLKIEGGAAGTSYTLISSEGSLSFSNNGASVTTATAANDASTFNAASVNLVVADIISSTSVDIDATSVYDSVSSSSITLKPSRLHTITVNDADSSPLSMVNITLNEPSLIAYGVNGDYVTDSSGEAEITLPDDNQSYSISASLSGYTTQDDELIDSQFTQVLSLQEVGGNIIELSGTITGINSLNFDSVEPAVTLTLSNEAEINIPVSVISAQQASYNYQHDASTGNIVSLSFAHADSDTVIVSISTNHSSIIVNTELRPKSVVVVTASSSGSMGFLLLFALLLILFSFKQRNQSKSPPLY